MIDALTDMEHLDPDARGRAFERLIKWWLTADPVFAAQIRRAWLWSEWPGRWGPDAGIDIVAETHTGDLWAIQTKAYAPTATVTKASIDSFLSESNRALFVHRVLVATTDRIAPNALRAIHGQEKSVGLVRRLDLSASVVRWPASLAQLDGSQTTAPRRNPRPHQQAAIADVTASLPAGGRGQLLMACGTGKTLTALWIAEELKSRQTLVLVPTLSLMEQTMREWLANTREPFRFLAVCSDDTVVPEHDEPVAYTSDLGIPVTTDAIRVEEFLREGGRGVVFATYQSSQVVAAAQRAAGVPAFDLAVADEAHRCAGLASSAFATILDDGQIRVGRRLFMTATPRYFTRRVRQQVAQTDLELVSMDDEALFGPVLHRLTFGEAITKELLSDYRVVVTAVDNSTYAAMAARAELVRGEGLAPTDARTLASELTVLRAMRRYQLRRVLSFHNRVNRARQFANELTGVAAWTPQDYRPHGRLWASWVAGEMNVGDRVARLDYLRNLEDGEHALLANARCLSEGVDIPAIDGVVFIEPRRSQVDVVQAVGRAIRLAPDKSLGTIVIPVFITPEDDPDTVLRSSDFTTVWDVVNALRAHDDVLGEELDTARRQLGRPRTTGGRPGKLILDLPISVSADFALAFDARLIEATSSTWEFWFGLLESFVERNGHRNLSSPVRRFACEFSERPPSCRPAC
jgi:predicted helicase